MVGCWLMNHFHVISSSYHLENVKRAKAVHEMQTRAQSLFGFGGELG